MLDTVGKGKGGEIPKKKKKKLGMQAQADTEQFLHSTSNNVITIKWCFSNCGISGFHVLILLFFLRVQVVLLGSY